MYFARIHLWTAIAVGVLALAVVAGCKERSAESKGVVAKDQESAEGEQANDASRDVPRMGDHGAAEAADIPRAEDDVQAPEPPPMGTVPTETNLKVAFFGDQALGSNPKKVLTLIKEEGAHLIIHLGDFDYGDNPDAWDQLTNQVLGEDYPLFAVVGNHDTTAWDGYRAKLQQRLERLEGAECSGSLGTKAACTYRGLFFILSGAGTMETEHDQFIAEALAADTHIWRVCSWHKTQSDMQPGYRPNEVGWGPYQACQQGRALIATAHEHSYARTRTLTDMGNADAGHGAKGAPDSVEVTHGSSFVFVSGLGGSSKADYHADLHDDDTWWASIYTENRYLNNGVDVADYDYDYGALFITFNVDGDATKARGVFKTIEGDTIDSFEVVTK